MSQLDTAVHRVRCKVLQDGDVALDCDVSYEKGQFGTPHLADGRYELAYEAFDEDGERLFRAPRFGYYTHSVGDGAESPRGVLRRLFRR